MVTDQLSNYLEIGDLVAYVPYVSSRVSVGVFLKVGKTGLLNIAKLDSFTVGLLNKKTSNCVARYPADVLKINETSLDEGKQKIYQEIKNIIFK